MARLRLGVLRTVPSRRTRAATAPHAENALLTLLIAAARYRRPLRAQRHHEARVAPPADATSRPFTGRARTPQPAPAPGSVQPVGGFSALLKGPARLDPPCPTTAFAEPRRNSHSFLLAGLRGGTDRTETPASSARSACATRTHGSRLRSSTTQRPQRYLTGGDFDIESFRIDRRGTLWFGDEFGPVPAPHRTQARPARCSSRRSRSPACARRDYRPALPARGSRTSPPGQRSSRGSGDAARPTGARCYPTLEGPAGRRRRQDASAARTRSTSPSGAVREEGARTVARRPQLPRVRPHSFGSKRFLSSTGEGPPGSRAVHKHSSWRRRISLETRASDDLTLGVAHARSVEIVAATPACESPVAVQPELDANSAGSTSQRHCTAVSTPVLAIARPTGSGATKAAVRAHPREGSSHSEKVISPHSWREWSSRRATCSSISRETAAGSK